MELREILSDAGFWGGIRLLEGQWRVTSEEWREEDERQKMSGCRNMSNEVGRVKSVSQ